jgi:sec-independent protein translocase protein TatC
MLPLITAEEYFSFVFAMVLTFGISFELPIVVLALSALGIVTPQFLSKYRRHAIVLIVIIGAFLTPGDLVWTTIALAVPLYMLYEISVAASYIIYKRKQRRRARLDAEQSEATA